MITEPGEARWSATSGSSNGIRRPLWAVGGSSEFLAIAHAPFRSGRIGDPARSSYQEERPRRGVADTGRRTMTTTLEPTYQPTLTDDDATAAVPYDFYKDIHKG